MVGLRILAVLGFVLAAVAVSHPASARVNPDTPAGVQSGSGAGTGMPAGTDPPTEPMFSVNGWEEAVSADAANVDGLYFYSYLQVQWFVPTEPVNNNNNSFFGLFPAIQLCPNDTNGCIGIVQPVLAWNVETAFPHAYAITTQEIIVGGNSSLQGYEEVNVDDTITGTMQWITSGEWAGYWYVEVYDNTSGAFVWNYWKPDAESGYAWSFAGAEVLEAYGTQNEGSLPASCNDMPGSEPVFYVLAAEQLGTSGNVLVFPDFLSYGYAKTPSGCGWGQYEGVQSGGYYNDNQYAYMTW